MVFLSPDGASGAMVVGAASLALGLIYSTILLTRPRPRAGIVTALLALIAGGGICLGTTGISLLGRVPPAAFAVVFAMGLVSIAAGVAISRQERRHEGYDPGWSLGLLYAGIGVFAVVCVVILPTLPTQFSPSAPPLPLTPTATITRTPPPTRTPRESATPKPLPTLTLTPTAIPTLTLTPTYDVPALPTSVEPTATLTATPVACTVTVDRNVNLRREPSADAERILTVPYQTVLPVIERSRDKGWWRVTFENQQGWVSAEFVTADPACKLVPTANAP